MSKHVLVIDDDDDVRSVIVTILESEGFVVSQALDGAAGQRLMATNPADLVLTDIMMPTNDGLEVVRDLRLAGHQTPIIVMSGSAAVEGAIMRAATAFGANLFLRKPFQPDDLIAAVRSLI